MPDTQAEWVRGRAKAAAKVEGVKASYARFCELVSNGTGLSLRVLAAWCLAEGGPDYNPLNIGPGRVYDGIEGGAKATIELLHDDLYKGIMATVGKDDGSQIEAIVASPWCPGCAGYIDLLKGTYQRVAGTPSTASSGPTTAASAGGTARTAAIDGELIGDEERSGALKALLWISFVGSGVALAWVGTGRMLGLQAPARKAAGAAANVVPVARAAKGAGAAAKAGAARG